jgi:hypothetical protein
MVKKEEINLAKSVTPAIIVPFISKGAKEAAAEKLAECIREETRMVRGIFQFVDHPGAPQKIYVKKYPTPAEMMKRGLTGGVEPFSRTLVEGCEYEIPLYVARFLNGIDNTAGALGDKNSRNTNIGTCTHAIHGFKMVGGNFAPNQVDDSGVPIPIHEIVKRKRRFGFQSLEFAGSIGAAA